MSEGKEGRGQDALGTSFENPLRVVVLGTVNGKTALIWQLIRGLFLEEMSFTLEDCYTYDMDGLCLEIYDTASTEEYREARKPCIRKSHVALLLFSLTEAGDFRGLGDFLDEMQEAAGAGNPLPFVLVGTKRDLEMHRQVTTQEAQEFAAAHNAPYIEASAKTGENVREAFEEAVSLALPESNTNADDKKPSRCCAIQ